MRQSLLAFAFAMMGLSGQAHAAPVATCNDIVLRAGCRPNAALTVVMALTSNECKVVQGRNQQNVAYIAEGGGRLTSVDTERCDVSDRRFSSGVIVDNKVFKGRLFAALSSGRVIMLGRNNVIYELRNAEGNPYSTVTGLRVGKNSESQDAIILERGNGTTPLTLEQIDRRIQQGKITPLAGSF